MINLGARGAGSRHKGASGPDDAESPSECWSHKCVHVVIRHWHAPLSVVYLYMCSQSVQSLSRVRFFATWWTAARQASLSITNSQSLFKFISIESVMPSNHLILCRPLLLPSLVFASIKVFSKESVLCIRWPKYWSFSLSISPSNEYSGLTSFMIDWLDLLAVQGTLKSLLQHHSSKALILQHSAFFIVQISHPYITTGKTIIWLDGPLSARWCLCFLICCLCWS